MRRPGNHYNLTTLFDNSTLMDEGLPFSFPSYAVYGLLSMFRNQKDIYDVEHASSKVEPYPWRTTHL